MDYKDSKLFEVTYVPPKDTIDSKIDFKEYNDIYETIEKLGKEEGFCDKIIGKMKKIISRKPEPVIDTSLKDLEIKISIEPSVVGAKPTTLKEYTSVFSGAPGEGGGSDGVISSGGICGTAGTSGTSGIIGYDYSTIDGSTSAITYHQTIMKNTKEYASLTCINNEGFENSFENGVEYMKVGKFENTICMIDMCGEKKWVDKNNFK